MTAEDEVNTWMILLIKLLVAEEHKWMWINTGRTHFRGDLEIPGGNAESTLRYLPLTHFHLAKWNLLKLLGCI